MKNKIKIIVLTMLCVFALAAVCSVADAQSAQSASVWTTDNTGAKMNEFALGQAVYIWWNPSPAGSTVSISVVDINNNPVAGPWLNQPVAASGTLSFTPPSPGYYFVDVNGQPAFKIAVATVFIFELPESAIGGLAALGAGLAAFGIFKIKHKKN